MLKEVYDFVKQNDIKEGDKYFVNRFINYHIALDSDGNLLDIEVHEKDDSYRRCPTCPDRGNKLPYPLVAKSRDVFGLKNQTNDNVTRHNTYMNWLKDAMEFTPEINAILVFINFVKQDKELRFITDKKLRELMETVLDSGKANISFRVDESYIEDLTSWVPYFKRQYDELLEKQKFDDSEAIKKSLGTSTVPEMISVVSGKRITPLWMTDSVTALGSDGGPIVSFNEDAFEHYGLPKSLNAAMSEEESKTIQIGLDYLFTNNYSSRWGCIYWFNKDVPQVARDVFEIYWGSDSFGLEDRDEKALRKKTSDEKEAILKELLDSIFIKGPLMTGERIRDTKFNIVNVKPVQGRQGFSDFRTKSFNEILDNLQRFSNDSALSFEGKVSPIIKVYSILTSLLYSDDMKKIAKEYSFQERKALMDAVLYDKQIPYDFLVRAVNKVGRHMVLGKTEKNKKKLSSVVYKVIKLYLNRDIRLKGGVPTIMPELNKDNKDIAYNCGRLLCVYQKIQDAALGDVNSGISSKYYTSASTKPAFVFGRLGQLCNYYLAKLEEKNAIYYKKIIQEISSNIPDFPRTLSLVEQASFSLGYYQQEKDSYTKKDNSKNVEEENVNA